MNKKPNIVINFTEKLVIIKSKLGLDKITLDELSIERLSEVLYRHYKEYDND